MSKKKQTPGFKVSDYINSIKQFAGKDFFDYILVNNKMPPSHLLEKYSQESELIENDLEDSRIIFADVLDEVNPKFDENDAIASTRALIRHDSHKLATELMKIVTNI